MLKFSILKYILFISFFYVCFAKANTEDITLYVENFPSESIKISKNLVGGISGEIVTKAFSAKNMTYKAFWTRWKMAQNYTQKNSDKKSFIMPLTRNPEREKSYKWVVSLYNIDTVFWTLKGSKKLNSLAEAKGKKIGVLLGSSYENKLLNPKSNLLREDIISVPYDSFNLKKLLSGEIQAFYESIIGGKALIESEKLYFSDFENGKTIDTEENYLATSHATPDALVAKVKNAVEEFKKTDDYKEIIKKYTAK
ncbi:MAG: hypothetical protein DCC88_08555 [Spirobacillus cienkowskii]|uniref:Solute-binding protein family 3/N-terminal domain-containing protein n=1 Tax=Spirobacillus cienkowskii TaxID=495820 RepID=A0A369KQT3_9BACT|nr:MAG: hypothetical protein DCC88_08555 [Spirobacillus cienkowskii]